MKRSVLTEQFANITKRYHEDEENDDPNRPKKRTRHQSQGLSDILDHMSGGNVKVKTRILASVIDAQGTEVAKGVAKYSKEIQLTNKLTKEKTAALISGSNMSDYQVKQLRTACYKELGANPFASAHKVTHARNKLLAVNREDWETNFYDLYRNKVGKNADKKKRTCVLNVKNLKKYIEKVAVTEKEILLCVGMGMEAMEDLWQNSHFSTMLTEKSSCIHSSFMKELM